MHVRESVLADTMQKETPTAGLLQLCVSRESVLTDTMQEETPTAVLLQLCLSESLTCLTQCSKGHRQTQSLVIRPLPSEKDEVWKPRLFYKQLFVSESL